tara:strand:+ start:299 stop:1045 length:747 start_codon:yes stop_codon:yes gene_type:complete
MNKIHFFLIISLISLISCKSDQKIEKGNIENQISKKFIKKIEKSNFMNSFKIDTTLAKKKAFGYFKISNSIKEDSILSLCSCKKNKKNNRIKIQLKTEIPTQKELDTMEDNSKNRYRFFQFGDLSSRKTINGQFKFLTIVLKDSMVESINLYSKSTEKEYNGIDFDSLSIKKYKINISKFNYSIASNVYGSFELHLNKGFGFFENDTILKSDFLCNNSIITEKEIIKNLKIKESFENRHNDRGFRIIE